MHENIEEYNLLNKIKQKNSRHWVSRDRSSVDRLLSFQDPKTIVQMKPLIGSF